MLLRRLCLVTALMGRAWDEYQRQQIETWRFVWFAAIFGAIAACPVILLYQIYGWLKTGMWESINIGSWLVWSGAQLPRVSWIGLQKLLDMFISIPLAAALPGLGFGMLWITAMIETANRKAR